MPGSIELSDLGNKPFYELDLAKYHRPARAYAYVALEFVTTLVFLYSYDYLISIHRQFGPACLGAATAALAQSLNQLWKYKVSDSRLLKFVVWGLINGYFTALWLDVLVVQIPNPVLRIVLDQTVGAPLFQLTFTVLSSMWDGDLMPAPQVRATFLRSLRYSYCYWPFVSMALFTLVPQNRMVFFNCLANFIWNVILSRLT